MLAICLIVPSGCIRKVEDDSSKPVVADSINTVDQVDSLVITLVGIESKSVLDVLMNSHSVEMKSSAMGAFVVAIDSIENGNDVYWMYSVNGDMGQVACDRFLTRPDDTIRWHFRILSQ
ncbi:MAG: DUF4430 domain-containing protein [candidate division Zixibacteria bacterium]|nr:DUF4430 domain-containing protein [candidate division Zixibacteria bacterium]